MHQTRFPGLPIPYTIVRTVYQAACSVLMLDLGLSGSVVGTNVRPTKKSGVATRLPAIKGGGGISKGGEHSMQGMSVGGVSSMKVAAVDAKMANARGMQRGALGQAAAKARQRAKQAPQASDANAIPLGSVENRMLSCGVMEVQAETVQPKLTAQQMQMQMQMQQQEVGIAFQQYQKAEPTTGTGEINTGDTGGIVFDVESMASPQKAQAQRAPERKPKGMTRAKVWSAEVENMFRFQLAGWRDVFEYISTHEAPQVWEPQGFIRCLQNKNGNFMYFRGTPECENKHLPKVKIFTY